MQFFTALVVSHLLRGLPALPLRASLALPPSACSAVQYPSCYMGGMTVLPRVSIRNFIARVIARKWVSVDKHAYKVN